VLISVILNEKLNSTLFLFYFRVLMIGHAGLHFKALVVGPAGLHFRVLVVRYSSPLFKSKRLSIVIL